MSTERTRVTRAEAMADTRRRLLDAAWAVFARQGYDGTSVKDVADAAGYTTGAIYAHFHTKQDLFLALLRERFATKIDDLADIIGSGEDLDTQMSSLGRRFGQLRSLEGDWDLLATEFWLYAARNPDARDPLVERQHELRSGVARIITERLADFGMQPATPPEQIATAVIALGDGLGALRRLSPELDLDELFAAAVLHLVIGLAQHPPAN